MSFAKRIASRVPRIVQQTSIDQGDQHATLACRQIRRTPLIVAAAGWVPETQLRTSAPFVAIRRHCSY
ncbi:MAG: hypothetical protein EOO77_36365 [Oxalobacteraceae bacterium]|nr:MAG: hypothetical protein EOO77_36365 [Oxalobacteraceae bacterium]